MSGSLTFTFLEWVFFYGVVLLVASCTSVYKQAPEQINLTVV